MNNTLLRISEEIRRNAQANTPSKNRAPFFQAIVFALFLIFLAVR